ncbi:hypothetical protein GGR08_000556 [Bartonella fuyuanensis]|uniref:Uncharacterized protein n=1 Tax=Bartonella fuyuanensis TaxID=1460968 RepID=A0A840DX66_9HYPH|nr:hypothetical protein [Bartonella fuyuanensis]
MIIAFFDIFPLRYFYVLYGSSKIFLSRGIEDGLFLKEKLNYDYFL